MQTRNLNPDTFFTRAYMLRDIVTHLMPPRSDKSLHSSNTEPLKGAGIQIKKL